MAISSYVDGVWISGAPAAVPATAGFTFNQLSGVWISGAGEAIPDLAPEAVHPPGMRRRAAQIREEDETILAVIIAFLEMKNR